MRCTIVSASDLAEAEIDAADDEDDEDILGDDESEEETTSAPPTPRKPECMSGLTLSCLILSGLEFVVILLLCIACFAYTSRMRRDMHALERGAVEAVHASCPAEALMQWRWSAQTTDPSLHVLVMQEGLLMANLNQSLVAWSRASGCIIALYGNLIAEGRVYNGSASGSTADAPPIAFLDADGPTH